MRIIGLDGGCDQGQIDRAIGQIFQRLRLNRPQHGHATALPAVGVGLLPEDGLFAARALRHHGNQIGLGTRRDKERRFEAEHVRDIHLQFEHGRVVTEDIIAYGGAGHGVAHSGGGTGDGVAAKVQGGVHRRFQAKRAGFRVEGARPWGRKAIAPWPRRQRNCGCPRAPDRRYRTRCRGRGWSARTAARGSH